MGYLHCGIVSKLLRKGIMRYYVTTIILGLDVLLIEPHRRIAPTKSAETTPILKILDNEIQPMEPIPCSHGRRGVIQMPDGRQVLLGGVKVEVKNDNPIEIGKPTKTKRLTRKSAKQKTLSLKKNAKKGTD